MFLEFGEGVSFSFGIQEYINKNIWSFPYIAC
jgi:hypothetical protein